MGRGINRLSPARVRTLRKPGLYADGGNLWLRVKKGAGGATNKSWLFRYALDGKEHLMGLGPLRDRSLAEAREIAAQARKLLLDGDDPLENKRRTLAEKRVAAIPVTTFKQAATAYIQAHDAGWRSAKHARDWADTLDRYAHPVMGALPVQAINTDLVLKCLEPNWETKTQTMSRLRGRIERIIGWAKARGLRNGGDNPAVWANLQHLLPKPTKVHHKQHHAAMAFEEVGAFMAALRELGGAAARALEFTVLTAARAGEVRLATWDEVRGEVWTVPGSRMKTGKEHRVPLCPRAVEIVDEMRELQTCELIFPGRSGGAPLGPMAMLQVLERLGHRGITVHGFRSTFRDWCGARSNFPREVAEMALAHRIGNATEQAYLRDDLFAKRRRMMDAWCTFCSKPMAKAKVLPLRPKKTLARC